MSDAAKTRFTRPASEILQPKIAPEKLFQRKATLEELKASPTCRVCGRAINVGENVWAWRYRSTSLAHGNCGWFIASDGDAAHYGGLVQRYFEGGRKPQAWEWHEAHELGLVSTSDGGITYRATFLMQCLRRQLALIAAWKRAEEEAKELEAKQRPHVDDDAREREIDEDRIAREIAATNQERGS